MSCREGIGKPRVNCRETELLSIDCDHVLLETDFLRIPTTKRLKIGLIHPFVNSQPNSTKPNLSRTPTVF